jgi:hypothetical protein
MRAQFRKLKRLPEQAAIDKASESRMLLLGFGLGSGSRSGRFAFRHVTLTRFALGRIARCLAVSLLRAISFLRAIGFLCAVSFLGTIGLSGSTALAIGLADFAGEGETGRQEKGKSHNEQNRIFLHE